jgi:translation initiation factor 1
LVVIIGRHNSKMQRNPSGSGLVYSTDAGRMCPDCRQPFSGCICRQAQAVAPADGVARVSRSTKGRGGKTVTVVKGLALDALALVQLGKQLRAACGSGGTAKDGVIEVQGDHCDLVLQALEKQGYAAKRAGG